MTQTAPQSRSLAERARLKYYSLYATLFGKVPFKDSFGLHYYMWKDARLHTAVVQGVRTDDSGVIVQAFNVLEQLGAIRKVPLVCFDAGAYVGVITLAMASRVPPGGHVYSFEPSTTNYARLLDNIRMNRYENVSALRLALSDSVGEATLRLTDDPGNSFLLHGGTAEVPRATHRRDELVPTTTIDDFAHQRGIDAIDLLKIDVEGSDDRVLAGAGQLLGSGAVSYVIVEIHQGDPSGERSLSMLRSHNYDIFYIVRNSDFLVRNLSSYPTDGYKPALNVLAVSPKAPAFRSGEGLDVRG